MRAAQRQRGISLVEAMVALAVMAFGTLAVLGVQTTLRLNGDIARQRNEAVRIAQETLEQGRSIAVLDDYEALATTVATDVPGYADANTTFRVETRVEDAEADAVALSPALPSRRKTLVVDVSWLDRLDQQQTLRLTSVVQGTEPALAGSLAVPADAAYVRNPRRRHPAIPPGAIEQGDGTSRFAPPGGGTVTWVFNNVTGFITTLCTGATEDTCVAYDARLLSGFVRYATVTAAGGAPTGADSESPLGAWEAVAVQVLQTAPVSEAGTVACFGEMLTTTAAELYYCAVPVGAATAWSGQSIVVLPTARAFDAADAVSPDRRRVCRYTPVRNAQPVAPTEIANKDHPLHYVDVATSLTQQNFLVIRAGDGTSAYECPGDGPSTYFNSNTWKHQPST